MSYARGGEFGEPGSFVLARLFATVKLSNSSEYL